jgi:hypothetical protein
VEVERKDAPNCERDRGCGETLASRCHVISTL